VAGISLHFLVVDQRFRQNQSNRNSQSFLPISTIQIPTNTDSRESQRTGWKTYVDKRYGYTIQYPSDWHLTPTANEGYGAVATFSNYDPEKVSGKSGFSKDMLKVQITRYDKSESQSFADWANTTVLSILQSSEDYGVKLKYQTPVTIDGINGMQYLLTYTSYPAQLLIYFPKSSRHIYNIDAYPADSTDLDKFKLMIKSFRLMQ
jgi:hypothetical protein